MEPESTTLPFIVHLDDCDAPADVLDSAALAPFVAGEHRWAETRHIDRVRPEASLLPPDVEPVATAVEGGRKVVLARGEGWSLRVCRWPSGSAELAVTAASAEI